MTRAVLRIVIAALWATLVMAAFPEAARAKIVAIMFDDSGSMGGKIQLPAFGAQLLVSSLDGRDDADRLLTARMSEAGESTPVTVQDISTPDRERRLIDEMASQWTKADGGTPFTQISLLLEKIGELQRPGEPAFLVILTDGEFTGAIPSASMFEASYRAVKARLNGPLRVDYLLIGADQPSRDVGVGGTVRDVVEMQGIRRALLDVFNGSPDDGRYDVVDADELTNAIKDIIVRTASADRRAQGRLIERRPDALSITSPLSISRIVTISTGRDKKELAKPRTDGTAARDSLVLSSQMLKNDASGAWANLRLVGEARHIRLDPAWPADVRLDLAFDGDPRETLVLLETPASLRLYLVDEDGHELHPDAGGRFIIARGSRIRLFSEVRDLVGDVLTTIPRSRLGSGAAMWLLDETPAASVRLSDDVDHGADAVFAPLPTDAVREGKLSGELVIDGLKAAAKPLFYKIIDADADLSLSFLSSDDCPGCDDGVMRRSLPIGKSDLQIGSLQIDVDAPLAGQVEVKLDAEDQRLSLSEHAKASTLTVPVDAGHSRLVLPVFLSGPTDAAILAGIREIDLLATAAGRMTIHGRAEVKGRVVLDPPRPEMSVLAHSSDPVGKGVLTLDLDDLREGRDFVDVGLKNVVGDPVGGRISVVSGDWLDFVPASGASGSIRLVPALSSGCECFLYFRQGARELRLGWQDAHGVQKAETTLAVDVRITLEQALWACLWLLIAVMLTLYLLWGLVYASRARVFPSGSGVDVTYERDDPRFVPFPSWLSTRIGALIWPVGNRNQKCRIEGLFFEASGGGASISMARSDPSYRFEFSGQSIAEIREEAPTQTAYQMSWDECAESRAAGYHSVRLLRKPSDRVAPPPARRLRG